MKKPGCANFRSYNNNFRGYSIKLIWFKPIKFDSPVNIIISNEPYNIKYSFAFQKKRNIDLVKFDELLDYEELRYRWWINFLESPLIGKIENDSTSVTNKFGVFKKQLKLDKGVRTTNAINNGLDLARDGGTPYFKDSSSEYFHQTNDWISNELREAIYIPAFACQGIPIYSTNTHKPENETNVYSAYKVVFHYSSNNVTSSDDILTKPSINNEEIGILTKDMFGSSDLNKIVRLHDDFNFIVPHVFVLNERVPFFHARSYYVYQGFYW